MLVNKANGHRYVGQTINFHNRLRQHRVKTHQGRSVIGRAFRKHGKDGFDFVIVERCGIKSLNTREIHHISTIRPEYNMTPGGIGSKGHIVSKEIRARLAKAGRAQWNRLGKDEQRAIIERMQLNRKPVSIETRAKIGASRRRYRQEHPDFLLKPVIKMDGSAINLAYFKSVNDAASATGIHPSAISRAVRGKRILAAGYFWKYQRERDNQ